MTIMVFGSKIQVSGLIIWVSGQRLMDGVQELGVRVRASGLEITLSGVRPRVVVVTDLNIGFAI